MQTRFFFLKLYAFYRFFILCEGFNQSVPLYRWVTLHIKKLYCDGNCWDDFKKTRNKFLSHNCNSELKFLWQILYFWPKHSETRGLFRQFQQHFQDYINISAIRKEHSFKSCLTYAFGSKYPDFDNCFFTFFTAYTGSKSTDSLWKQKSLTFLVQNLLTHCIILYELCSNCTVLTSVFSNFLVFFAHTVLSCSVP